MTAATGASSLDAPFPLPAICARRFGPGIQCPLARQSSTWTAVEL